MELVKVEKKDINILFCQSLEDISSFFPKDRKVIIVIDKKIEPLYGKYFNYPQITVEASEQLKSFSGIDQITRDLLNLEADRGSIIIAVGGGTLTDLAGFVASIYMRGIDFAYVPTTLLAQVDASIGGKTAINFDGYKNILGVINQPLFTLICPEFLDSLSKAAVNEGLSEMLKTFLIKDSESFFECKRLIENGLINPSELEKLILKTALIKAEIVKQDPNEKGVRILLNLGHTFAHAIEKNSKISHGEAVGIGLVLASKLSYKLGYLSNNDYILITKVIEDAGLPVSTNISSALMIESIKKDKKREGEYIKFVVLQHIGNAIVHKIHIDSLKLLIDDLS